MSFYVYNTHKELNDHFKLITTKSGDVKDFFIKKWRFLCEDSYILHKLYGLCKKNNMVGVLTPSHGWSPINQFNTNYSVNLKLSEYVNELIKKEFILKGVPKINGRKVKDITFNKEEFDDSQDYIIKEIENYFFWLNHYKEKIFVDLRKLKPDDFLYELITLANKTMGNGTFGESCVEYYLKKNMTDVVTHRTSSIRGNLNDMVGGYDLYTTSKINDDVEKYQSKVVKMYDDSFNAYIDCRNYYNKGIRKLVLVELNYFNDTINPSYMTFLNLKPDTIYKDGFKYRYKKEHLIMKTEINEIFHSKIFYEFFMYCSKQDIHFSFEVGDDNSFDYNKENKSVSIVLPKESEEFNDKIILDGWRNVIDDIETDNEMKSKLQKDLDKFLQ